MRRRRSGGLPSARDEGHHDAAEQLEQLAAGDRVLGMIDSAAVLEAAARNIRARPLAQMQKTDIALVEAVVAATRRIGGRPEADVLLKVVAVALGRPPTERELELAKHAAENEGARLVGDASA